MSLAIIFNIVHIIAIRAILKLYSLSSATCSILTIGHVLLIVLAFLAKSTLKRLQVNIRRLANFGKYIYTVSRTYVFVLTLDAVLVIFSLLLVVISSCLAEVGLIELRLFNSSKQARIIDFAFFFCFLFVYFLIPVHVASIVLWMFWTALFKNLEIYEKSVEYLRFEQEEELQEFKD